MNSSWTRSEPKLAVLKQPPDVVTYNTLISLAPDYDEAKLLLKQMRVELITPNEYTYSIIQQGSCERER